MHVKSNEINSELVISHSCPNFNHLGDNYHRCVILSDENVYPKFEHFLKNHLQSAKLPFCEIILPSGEPSKSLLTAQRCWEEMKRHQLDRYSCVIALGGGMITDLAGFVASCYMRGIDVISIPTSLVGMVDAAIGGKTAINLSNTKNFVGTFHQPKLIWVNSQFLQTLPEREFRSGLAEIIKYGVIRDPTLFEYIEIHLDQILKRNLKVLNPIIERSCWIKMEYVKEDPLCVGIRSHLNWGHTFAHAIEDLTDYQQFLHGEAVSIGMSCAAHVSHHLGTAPIEFVIRQDTLLKRADLPTTLPSAISIDELIFQMQGDKKSKNRKIHLIVAEKIGKVVNHYDVNPSIIKEALTQTDK